MFSHIEKIALNSLRVPFRRFLSQQKDEIIRDDSTPQSLKTLAEYISKSLPKYVQKADIVLGNELEVKICPQGIFPTIAFLKDHHTTQFTNIIDITAIDVPTRKYRFELIYHFLSLKYNQRIRLQSYTDELTPVDSITPIFEGANWFEREIYDMFGIFFTNHPDLRRILTDYGFQGHPLRKDFPLSGFNEVRYDDEYNLVVTEPLELTQEYRKFDLNTPWEVFPTMKQDIVKQELAEKQKIATSEKASKEGKNNL